MPNMAEKHPNMQSTPTRGPRHDGNGSLNAASRLEQLRQQLVLLDEAIKATEKLEYVLSHDCVMQ